MRVTWSYDASDELINERRSGVNGYNTTYSYNGRMNRTLKNDSGALTTYSYDVADESGTCGMKFPISGVCTRIA